MSNIADKIVDKILKKNYPKDNDVKHHNERKEYYENN